MNHITITSGIYRGRKIIAPGGGTHPMGERERLALFNMISDLIPEARVLDAYCGSGALGIEALSRGAESVVFVDKNARAMRVTRQNCDALEVPLGRCEFYQGSVERFCDDSSVDEEIGGRSSGGDDEMARGRDDRFDLVLTDPPYDGFRAEEVGNLACKCLDDNGVLVLSHPGEAPELSGLDLIKTRKYARAHISVYRMEDNRGDGRVSD